MTEDDANRRFEERARRLFREQAESLDGATRSRLAQARARALERQERPATFWPWLSAGAVAAVAGVTAVAVLQTRDATLPLEDLDVLMADESLELLEDLEFYLWLDEHLDAG